MWAHGTQGRNQRRPARLPPAGRASNSCWRIRAGRSGRARTTAPGPFPKGWCGRTICSPARSANSSEETGLTAQGPFVPLKPVRQKSGKTVHGFAFEADLDLTKFSSNTFEMEWPPRSGQRKEFPGDRPDRLVRRARGDGKDHRLSAAVPGRVAGEARGKRTSPPPASAGTRRTSVAGDGWTRLCAHEVGERYALTSCRWNAT